MSAVNNGLAFLKNAKRNISPEQRKHGNSNWNGFDCFWFNAITSCNLQEISKLLSEDSTLAHWKNPFDGWTALHYFAKNGNLRCLDFLVKKHNVDVNVICQNGTTPLHVAVMFSQRLFIRCLIEDHHARTDIMDYAGRFPLNLMSPDLSYDFEKLLSCGRLSHIQNDLSILTANRLSRKWIEAIPATNLVSSVQNGGIKMSTLNRKVVLPEANLLLSFLSDSSKKMEDFVRCLRHGKKMSFDADPLIPSHLQKLSKSSIVLSKSMTLDTHKLKHATSLMALGKNRSVLSAGSSNTLPFGRVSSADTRIYRRGTLVLPTIEKTCTLRKENSNVFKFSTPRKPSVFKRNAEKLSNFARYSFSGFPSST